MKTKRAVPKGTGFEPGLFTTQGLPLDQAQTMEKDFVAKLDTRASEDLVMLETGLPEGQWTGGPRSAWFGLESNSVTAVIGGKLDGSSPPGL